MKKIHALTFLSCAVAVAFAATINAFAQNQGKAQVMILGVYHFDNPNQDYVKTDFDNHLSEKRQKQIAEVLESLAKFKPTKVVVEAPPEAVKVQQRYESYLKGEYKLTANETEQLGFRLAKQFDHKQVYLGDHKIEMDFDAVMAAAQQTNNRAFLEGFQKVMAEVQEMQKRHALLTVREALIELNDPKHNDRTRDFYLQLARVRSADKFVGADVLSDWYKRNFRIFTNILQVIESPGDRVLVIFGQGHGAYLRDWVKSYPDLQLIEPNDYLKQR